MTMTYPKSVKLDDGSQVILKTMGREDFEFSLGFFRRQPEDDRIFLRRDSTKREMMEERMVEIEEGNTTVIMAIANGMIVGEATLYTMERGLMRKTGEFRIMVDVSYRRKGLGLLLTDEVIKYSKDLGLIKLMTEVLDKQEGMHNLLKSLGFEQEGRLKDFVLDLKEVEHDLLIFGKSI